MSDLLVTVINISYLIIGNYTIDKLNLRFTGERGTWSNTCATLFIASIFFVIGLLLFDIPLAFFGYNTPEGIQWLKSVWWFYPLASFIALLISLALMRSIFAYIRGRTQKEGAKARLFLGCASVSGSLFALALIAWLANADPEFSSPQLGDVAFLLIAWALSAGGLFLGAVVTKSALNK